MLQNASKLSKLLNISGDRLFPSLSLSLCRTIPSESKFGVLGMSKDFFFNVQMKVNFSFFLIERRALEVIALDPHPRNEGKGNVPQYHTIIRNLEDQLSNG